MLAVHPGQFPSEAVCIMNGSFHPTDRVGFRQAHKIMLLKEWKSTWAEDLGSIQINMKANGLQPLID